MNGYKLSAKAAAAERRYAMQAMPPRKKDITEWRSPDRIGYEDRDNFVTNRVTLADWNDRAGGNALGLSAVWGCVNLLAGTIASLPLKVMRRGDDGVEKPAPEHPLYWILHDSPNFDQTNVDFWEFMCTAIELQGNAYAEIERRADGFVVSLTPIRPDLVRVKRVDGDLEYRWSDDGEEYVRDQLNILHIRGFAGSPTGGISTLSACGSTFGSAISANTAATSMFRNGVSSSGAVESDTAFTGEQRKVLKSHLAEEHQGAVNAGRPMLLDNGLKWTQISLSPEDAQMLETRRFGIEEICRIFGVPPHMIGHTDGNTSLGSSISEQTLGFVKFTLRRRLKRIETALQKQLLSREELRQGYTIAFNLEGLLRADSKGRAEFYDVMQQFMTKNEIRALEGLPPIAGGDVLMAQMQDVPLSEALRNRSEDAA